MSLGAAIQIDKMFKYFPGQMLVAISFNKGFNDQPGNSTKARLLSVPIGSRLIIFLSVQDFLSAELKSLAGSRSWIGFRSCRNEFRNSRYALCAFTK
jgi:hypothetical protein